MSDTKELIRRALCDAIEWQRTFIESNRGFNDEEARKSQDLIDGYLKILKRRYGMGDTPAASQLAKAAKEGCVISGIEIVSGFQKRRS